MQALVTGASGFIGSELARQLAAQGVRVRALLRETSSRGNLDGLDYETAPGDLADQDALKSAVKGVDVVFHLAGVITARNRAEYFLHNSGGTANLAAACADANPGLRRFVYVSSIAAAGPAGSASPRVESEKESPVSDYGASKLGGERGLDGCAFPVTVVRPPVVYGPRDKGVFEFVKLVNHGILPVLRARNGGEKLYSMIHVEDLARGIALAGFGEGQGSREVFFLSGDGVHAWSDIMGTAAEALGRKPLRVPLPMPLLKGMAALYDGAGLVLGKPFPLTRDKIHEFEADRWICSNERAKKVLGFKPTWEMRPGLAQTISWYKQHRWI